MNQWLNPFVDASVQCWGCPMFDRLFQIVSNAAASVYNKFAFFCAVLFCVLFAFFALNAVWQNIKGGMPDPMYKKSIQKVFISALFAMSFLSFGVALPRFITTITFEPVAEIATVYTQAMLNTNTESVVEKVTYQPMKMSDNGFYRPQLRDKIIVLMKTTITQFQSYIKLGIAIIDKAFSWSALASISALFKHIILLFIGIYLTKEFFMLFFRFCCYFADIIIAMAFFAFFFPLSLSLFAFKGADNVPKWIGGLGKNVGTHQFKNLINAIIALAAAVITYTVIMVIIAKFFSAPGVSSADLMQAITSGEIFAGDLNTDNLANMTLMSTVVLLYIISFLQKQIPKVTDMTLAAFNVSSENKLSEQLADDTMQLTKDVWNTVKKLGETIIKPDDKKDSK